MRLFGNVIRHADHIPLDGVEVKAWDATERKEIGKGISTDKGAWEMEIEKAGTYLFEFKKDGFHVNALHALIPNNAEVSFDPVVLKPMVGIINLAAVKDGPAHLWEDIVLDDRERPVIEVHVQAFMPDQDILVAEAITGVDGRFRMLLKPGHYDILYYKFGWNQNMGAQAKVTVSEDGTVNLEQEEVPSSAVAQSQSHVQG